MNSTPCMRHSAMAMINLLHLAGETKAAVTPILPLINASRARASGRGCRPKVGLGRGRWSEVEATVDRDDGAGHVGAGGAGQADCQGGHFLLATPAFHRDQRGVL